MFGQITSESFRMHCKFHKKSYTVFLKNFRHSDERYRFFFFENDMK